jgi:hypothetical protein
MENEGMFSHFDGAHRGAPRKMRTIIRPHCGHSKCKIDENHTFELSGSDDIKALYKLLKAVTYGGLQFGESNELMGVRSHYMSEIEGMIECVFPENNEPIEEGTIVVREVKNGK